jgi:8-oxo-dGTP pyrophosphatase MutT (NUDIX family)
VSAPQIPERLAARARDFLTTGWDAVTPRQAATVVLLRDGADGPEAYLLRRVASMAFAAGMHVFPGGTVDPRDGDVAVPWSGPEPATWTGRLEADESLTRALVCAAVRETFEESGVLLAGPDSASIVADTTGADWEEERQALVDRRLAFSDLLTQRRLVVRADLLRPWAHWMTPEFEERRFDTRFLVAAMPRGQRTRPVGGEADRVAWLRPADAVAGFERGDLAMLPPTIVTMRELSSYGSVDEILVAADQREIRMIMPKPVLAGDTGDEVRLLLPGDEGYPW